MRHVRMLGLCLVATFAMTAVAAVPALAHVPGTLTGEWKVYKDCPINNPEFTNPAPEFDGGTQPEAYCFVGKTSGGKEGGQFTVGAVTTPLSKPVTLQGGVVFYYHNTGNGNGLGHVLPAEGGETLSSPALPIPKGINLITRALQEETHWPRRLTETFDYAKLHKETKMTAKISVAGGNLLYEEEDALSTGNLLEQNGPAFTLPLKVTINGPWLESLGGTCLVGNEAHPVIQHLTSGKSEAPSPFEANTQEGAVGELHFNSSFTNITIDNSKLVDSTWPVEAQAECSGEYASYVDAAMNKLLELPAPAGKSTTTLKGTLGTGNGAVVKSESETGEE